jgi:hypothetical protein
MAIGTSSVSGLCRAANQAQRTSPPQRSMQPDTKYQTIQITLRMSAGRETLASAARTGCNPSNPWPNAPRPINKPMVQ